jgi:hypothetical protein
VGLAATAIVIIPFIVRQQRIASRFFCRRCCNRTDALDAVQHVLFDDPLMFAFGRGSARDYAQEYFSNGKTFATAGKLWDSLSTYFIDVAYCVNPVVLCWDCRPRYKPGDAQTRHWRPPVILSIMFSRRSRSTFQPVLNAVPLLMPGLQRRAGLHFNVRYGTIMAATIPLFAAMFLFFLIRQVERHRMFLCCF